MDGHPIIPIGTHKAMLESENTVTTLQASGEGRVHVGSQIHNPNIYNVGASPVLLICMPELIDIDLSHTRDITLHLHPQQRGRFSLPNLKGLFESIGGAAQIFSYIFPAEQDPQHFVDSFEIYEYTQEFKEVDEQLLKGTCEWIMRHSVLESWIHKQDCNLLWLTGSPGMGKTSLIVHIVQSMKAHLLQQKRTGSVAVLYSLCNSQENNTASTILCVALHQLLTAHPELCEAAWDLEKLSRKNFGGQAQRNADLLWQLFCLIIEESNLGKVYFLIDGLDDCSHDAQVGLLRLLENRPARLKVLIGSQPLQNLRAFLSTRDQAKSNWRPFDLDEEEELINVDIDKYIEENVARIARLLEYPPQVKEKVSNFLRERKTGVFLPVILVLRTLEETPILDVDVVLRSTSEHINKLDSLYQKLLSQIPKALLSRRSQILMYLVYSYRSLTITELAFACGYGEDAPSRNPRDGDNASAPQQLRRQSLRSDLKLLGPILRIRSKDDSVHFIHSSARHFLIRQSNSSTLPLDVFLASASIAHDKLSTLCVNCMIAASAELFPNFWEDEFAKKLKLIFQKHTLLEYAFENWDLHVKEAWKLQAEAGADHSYLVRRLEVLMGIFEKKGRRNFASLLAVRRGEYIFTATVEKVGRLNFYIWLGLNDLVIEKLGLDQKTSALPKLSTLEILALLETAARGGNFGIFKDIMDVCQIESLTDAHWSILVPLAATSGNAKLLRYILQKRGQLPKETARAALQAALRDEWSVLDVLVEDWDGLSATDGRGMNILHWIVTIAASRYMENAVVLKLVLFFNKHGLSLNEPDDLGNTVLHLACWSNDLPTVEFVSGLVKAGAKPGIRNYLGSLPIHLAARRARAATIEYLISETRIDDVVTHSEGTLVPYKHSDGLYAFNSNGSLSPLHWAMSRRCDTIMGQDFDVIRQLLQRGFSIASTTRSGRTPMSIALDNPTMSYVLGLVYFRLDGADNFSLSTVNTLQSLATAKTVDDVWFTLNLGQRFKFLPGIGCDEQLSGRTAYLVRMALILFILPRRIIASLVDVIQPETDVLHRVLESLNEKKFHDNSVPHILQYNVWNFLKHWAEFGERRSRVNELCTPLFHTLRYKYILKHHKAILAAEESLDNSNAALLRAQETTMTTRSTNKGRLKSIIETDHLMMRICWPRFVLALCQGSTDLWSWSELVELILLVFTAEQDDDKEDQTANTPVTEDASKGDHDDEAKERKEDADTQSDNKTRPELESSEDVDILVSIDAGPEKDEVQGQSAEGNREEKRDTKGKGKEVPTTEASRSEQLKHEESILEESTKESSRRRDLGWKAVEDAATETTEEGGKEKISDAADITEKTEAEDEKLSNQENEALLSLFASLLKVDSQGKSIKDKPAKGEGEGGDEESEKEDQDPMFPLVKLILEDLLEDREDDGEENDEESKEKSEEKNEDKSKGNDEESKKKSEEKNEEKSKRDMQ